MGLLEIRGTDRKRRGLVGRSEADRGTEPGMILSKRKSKCARNGEEWAESRSKEMVCDRRKDETWTTRRVDEGPETVGGS